MNEYYVANQTAQLFSVLKLLLLTNYYVHILCCPMFFFLSSLIWHQNNIKKTIYRD